MRTFERSLSANESWSIAGGNFFLLMTAANTVDVVFFRGGSEVGRMTEVTAGYWVRFTEAHLKQLGIVQGFDRVAVVNGSTAQTVKVVTAQEEAGANIVSSEISSVLNPLTPPSGAITQYRRSSASAALNTIVTPAANINGVKITGLYLGGGNTAVRAMYKTTAPTSYTDGVILDYNLYSGTVGNFGHSKLSLPIIVPAGYGLYEQAADALNATAVDMAYEVL